MFQTSKLRLFQTTRHFLPKVIPETLAKDMSRPTGLIASKGLELLTFGTPSTLATTSDVCSIA